MPASILIREIPETERPRERLLGLGSGVLTDAELIAVLLRTGKVGCSALQMAGELLRESGGLAGLLGLSAPALRRSGLGPAKAAALLAAIEIGRRLAREEIGEREPIAGPREVVRYLALRYGVRDQEVMGALFLDAGDAFWGTARSTAVPWIAPSSSRGRFSRSACCAAPPRSSSSTLIPAATSRPAPRISFSLSACCGRPR